MTTDYNDPFDEVTWEYEYEAVTEEDEEDDEYQGPRGSLDFEEFSRILHDLPQNKAVLFYGSTLLLCRKLLEGNDFAKYHKGAVNAYKTFKRNSTAKLKEEAFVMAEQVMLKLKKRVLNRMEERAALCSRPRITDELFDLSTDICLRYVSSSLSEEKITILVKSMSKFKNGVNGNRSMEKYAFVFFQCAREEIESYSWEIKDSILKDEDWVDECDKEGFDALEDWEFEDENYALDEQKYDISEYADLWGERQEVVDKHIVTFSRELQSLNDGRSLIFHATVLKMMMCTVRPRLYAKYWKTVRKLISTYIGESIDDTGAIKLVNDSKIRKSIEDLLSHKQWIFLCYPFFNASVDSIGEFNLISTAIERCLEIVREKESEDITSMLNSFSCNEITREYTCDSIEDLARECLDKAKVDILSQKSVSPNTNQYDTVD